MTTERFNEALKCALDETMRRLDHAKRVALTWAAVASVLGIIVALGGIALGWASRNPVAMAVSAVVGIAVAIVGQRLCIRWHRRRCQETKEWHAMECGRVLEAAKGGTR